MGQFYHIYCDESRQSKDRYMVLGGVIIDAKHVSRFHEIMHAFRVEMRMYAEQK